MLTVWKFELQPDLAPYDVPRGAQWLGVNWQDKQEMAVAYALVDTEQPIEVRHLVVNGTGLEIRLRDGMELGPFLGTVRIGPTNLYMHVFEVLE